MVVMVVGKEHEVNLREILEAKPRGAMTPRPDPADGAHAFGPDGIRQNIDIGLRGGYNSNILTNVCFYSISHGN